MNTINLRYVTLSNDPSSNHVIFETDKYDIELNDNLFQVMKNILSMNDNEILHMYNEIVNILDKSTILLLQSESSQTVINYNNSINIDFDWKDINEEMIKNIELLKANIEILFNKIKSNCDLYNRSLKYDKPNEACDKLIKVCDIIIDSLKLHQIYIVSSCIRIIATNIIEDEKDRLMKDEIKEAHKRNENIIAIDSYAKETTILIVYVSINNKMIISKMKNKKKKYLINIKNNTCSCPDFKLRKIKQGLCCKHLMEVRNKSYCLLMIDRVMNSLSQNSCNNSYVPLKHMLNVAYDNSINYNS